jgi:DNA-binding NarL/FixJ family response regulator
MDGAAAKGRVLIVDDQFLIVEFLRIWVEASGFEVCGTAQSAPEAIQQALELKPDVVLMDVQLERGSDGCAVAAEICKAMDAQIIFVTGANDAATMARIVTEQPFAVLIKPVDPMELGQALVQAMEAR